MAGPRRRPKPSSSFGSKFFFARDSCQLLFKLLHPLTYSPSVHRLPTMIRKYMRLVAAFVMVLRQPLWPRVDFPFRSGRASSNLWEKAHAMHARRTKSEVTFLDHEPEGSVLFGSFKRLRGVIISATRMTNAASILCQWVQGSTWGVWYEPVQLGTELCHLSSRWASMTMIPGQSGGARTAHRERERRIQQI